MSKTPKPLSRPTPSSVSRSLRWLKRGLRESAIGEAKLDFAQPGDATVEGYFDLETMASSLDRERERWISEGARYALRKLRDYVDDLRKSPTKSEIYSLVVGSVGVEIEALLHDEELRVRDAPAPAEPLPPEPPQPPRAEPPPELNLTHIIRWLDEQIYERRQSTPSAVSSQKIDDARAAQKTLDEEVRALDAAVEVSRRHGADVEALSALLGSLFSLRQDADDRLHELLRMREARENHGDVTDRFVACLQSLTHARDILRE